MNNNRVTESLLVKSLQYQCQQNSDGLHIIGLQDTTEYNYNHHIKRLKKDTLGVVGNNSNLGYYAHLMVAFDAVSCLPQGISYCKMWGREHHRKNRHERQYQDLPIEEKESYRWLEAADQTRKLLSTAKHFTFISDRESDIYQLWDRIPDDKTDFIIRARGDRSVFEQQLTVLETLNQTAVAGCYTIELREDWRAKKSRRKALINLRYVELEVKKPRKLARHHAVQDHVVLTVVEAKEDPGSCKPNEPAVHWVLLTTHAVHDFEQACRIVEWYSFRWHIEQFFRLTKSQGIDLESSQLETGEALKKLGLIGFASALRILQLSLSRDGTMNDNVTKYFDKQEVELLHVLDIKLKGSTLKQQNPHPKNTLAWAAWVIARLGGYTGYASQSPPGPLTFRWGLDKFYLIKEGYFLVEKDVYKA